MNRFIGMVVIVVPSKRGRSFIEWIFQLMGKFLRSSHQFEQEVGDSQRRSAAFVSASTIAAIKHLSRDRGLRPSFGNSAEPAYTVLSQHCGTADIYEA